MAGPVLTEDRKVANFSVSCCFTRTASDRASCMNADSLYSGLMDGVTTAATHNYITHGRKARRFIEGIATSMHTPDLKTAVLTSVVAKRLSLRLEPSFVADHGDKTFGFRFMASDPDGGEDMPAWPASNMVVNSSGVATGCHGTFSHNVPWQGSMLQVLDEYSDKRFRTRLSADHERLLPTGGVMVVGGPDGPCRQFEMPAADADRLLGVIQKYEYLSEEDYKKIVVSEDRERVLVMLKIPKLVLTTLRESMKRHSRLNQPFQLRANMYVEVVPIEDDSPLPSGSKISMVTDFEVETQAWFAVGHAPDM